MIGFKEQAIPLIEYNQDTQCNIYQIIIKYMM